MADLHLKKHRFHCGLLIVFIALSSLFISGCSNGSVYDKLASYEASDEEIKALSEGRLRVDVEYDFKPSDFDNYGDYLKHLIAYYLSNGTHGIRAYAPLIIASSIALGILMLFTAKKSIKIRQMALFIFILGIPLFVFVAVYGSAILADSF